MELLGRFMLGQPDNNLRVKLGKELHDVARVAYFDCKLI